MKTQSKKSSWWGTFKNSYLRSHNLKNFYKKLDKTNISADLKKTINYFLNSESYEWGSKFWRKMIIDQLRLISAKGIKYSKDILDRNYFIWTHLNEHQIESACKLIEKNSINLNINMFKKYKNFSHEESINYNIILLILYENLKKRAVFKNLEKICKRNKNYFKEKPSLKLDTINVSQDDINSLFEYEKIENILFSLKNTKKNFLEIGSGSGRTCQTILSLNENAKYIIVDIPPALNISYTNINGLFPEKKLFLGLEINNENDFLKYYEKNDLIFIFPHQIKYIPDKFVDISIAINCLHEMEEKTVKKYMKYFEKKSHSLYFKVWENAGLPNSFYKYYSVHSKKDYFINGQWQEIFKERCIFPSNFYQLGYIF